MNPAVIKWIEIVAGVIVYELEHSRDGFLLSESCDHLIEKRPVLARLAIVGASAILTAHLANLLDPKYDLMAKSRWRWMR